MRRVRLIAPDDLHPEWDRIRDEQRVPDEATEAARATAEAAARRGPRPADRRDLTGIDFVTIDPPGSRDLDQAFAAERAGSGYVVHYAIADVAAFVDDGDPVDVEARRRGATIYLPDASSPLYPQVLSAGAASLLPDADRPALVWRIALDGDGGVVDAVLERAVVRSRAQLTYDEVQRSLDADRADDFALLLREIGRLRARQEKARGGVSLRLPAQDVRRTNGGYALVYESALAVESWNAQISLLAGICAAGIMASGGVGLLRTLPPPTADMVARLRRAARALDVEWPAGDRYSDVIRRCDPNRSTHLAFLTEAVRVFRGASYEVVEEPTDHPPRHSALATPYAHVTAPLRRLADRFANEIVVAMGAGVTPPDWAVAALDGLPSVMARASQLQRSVDRAVIDVTECVALLDRVGEQFDGVVVQQQDDTMTVQLRDPAVVVEMAGTGAPGADVTIEVHGVDVSSRRVDLAVVSWN